MLVRSVVAMALTGLSQCFVPAHAEEPAGKRVTFAGFGTVGVAHSTEKNADVISTFYQPNGVGHTREWGDIDSVFGFQGTAMLTNKLSAVVQVVVERQWKNAFRPSVEWANLKYSFNEDFSIRVGRVALPMFLSSDSRKVGYTSMWARPPMETYSIFEYSHSDGVDATHRFRMGEGANTLTALYGRLSSIKPDGTPQGWKAYSNDFSALINRLEYGPLTLQFSFGKGHGHQPKMADSPFPVLAELAHDVYLDIRAVGISYDPGQWFVLAEAVEFRPRKIGTLAGWHVGGGYRFGAFTPYAIHAERRPMTGPLAGPDSLAQTTSSLGLRWDFRKDIDVKIQFDRIKTGENSSGLFVNLQPGYQYAGKASMFSLVLDYVF